ADIRVIGSIWPSVLHGLTTAAGRPIAGVEADVSSALVLQGVERVREGQELPRRGVGTEGLLQPRRHGGPAPAALYRHRAGIRLAATRDDGAVRSGSRARCVEARSADRA